MAQLIKEMQIDSNVRSKINNSLKIRKDKMKCFKGDEILFAFKNKVYICLAKNDGILGEGFSKEIGNIGDYFTDGEVSLEVENIYNSSEDIENVNSVWGLFKIENPKEGVTYRTLTESNYPQEFINNYITEDKHSFTADEGNKYEYAFNLLVDYGSEEVKNRINRISMTSTFVNKFQTKDGIDVPLDGYAFLMHNGKCCFCGKYTDSDGYPLAMDEIISGSLRAEFSTDEIAHDEIYICPSYDSDFYTYPIEYTDTKLKSQPFEGVVKETIEHGVGLRWYHWNLEKEAFVGEIFRIKNINERLEHLYNNEQPAKFTLYMVETEHDFDFPYAIGQKLDERDKDLAYIKQTLNECGITAPLQESIDFYISMKPFKDYDRVKSETDGEIVFSNKNGLQDYHFGAGSEFTFTNGKWIERTKIENSKHLNENKIPTLAEALKTSDLNTFNSILKDEELYCWNEGKKYYTIGNFYNIGDKIWISDEIDDMYFVCTKGGQILDDIESRIDIIRTRISGTTFNDSGGAEIKLQYTSNIVIGGRPYYRYNDMQSLKNVAEGEIVYLKEALVNYLYISNNSTFVKIGLYNCSTDNNSFGANLPITNVKDKNGTNLVTAGEYITYGDTNKRKITEDLTFEDVIRNSIQCKLKQSIESIEFITALNQEDINFDTLNYDISKITDRNYTNLIYKVKLNNYVSIQQIYQQNNRGYSVPNFYRSNGSSYGSAFYVHFTLLDTINTIAGYGKDSVFKFKNGKWECIYNTLANDAIISQRIHGGNVFSRIERWLKSPTDVNRLKIKTEYFPSLTPTAITASEISKANELIYNSHLTHFNISVCESLISKECMATNFNKKECSTIIVDGNNQGVKHYIKDNRFIAYNYNDGSGKVVFHDARDSNIDKELPQHCSYLEFENVYNTDYFNYRNYHINNGLNRYDNMLNVDVVDFLKCGKEELPHLWKVKKIRVNKDNFPHFVSNEQKHKNVINKMRNYLCPLLKTVEISSKQEYDENESCSSINFDVPYNTKYTYILLKEDTSYQFKSIGVASRDNKFGGLDYRFASNLRNVKDVANAAISYLNNSSFSSFGQFGAKIICDATEATKTLTMETENGGQNFVVQKGNIVIQASPDLIGIILSAKGKDGWYDFDNEAEDYCNYQIIGMKTD